MTGITYRSDQTRNLSASEVDGNFLQLTQNKVETSVYSALAAAVLGLAAISAIAAGTTDLTAGTLSFGNSNGVTFGLNGATLTASVRTDYLTTAALSGHSHGNPTLALTNLSGSTASNSAGLTLSLSAAAPGAGAGISAAGSSQSNGTIVFSNSNGLSFGMNGSTVTGSHNGLTTAAQSNHSHGNPTLALTNLSGSTASNSAGLTISLSAAPPDGIGISAAAGSQTASSGTINFANSNGLTFGMSGSSQITGSYTVPETSAFLTTAALSNHSHGNPTLALTNLSGSTASNSAGLTLSLSAAAPAAGVAISAAGSSVSAGTLVFSNSNGISFGLSASTITASYTVPNTAGLLSAINLSAGTTSQNVSALTFENANGLSFGLAGSVVTASYSVPSQTGLVPYTGATADLNLGAHWLSQVRGLAFDVGDLTAPAHAEGQLGYDLKNLCMTLDMYGGARLQIGQELYIIVYNDSGSDIGDGQVVYQNASARIEYVSGKFGDYPTVRLAQANSVLTSDALGVSTTLIPNGGFGFVTAFGLVNTLDTSAWAAGDQLYLSEATPGEMTNVSPTTPNRSVLIARVIRSHATAGNIMLGLQQFANFADHLDVAIASPSNGDVVQYNGAVSKWENMALPAVSAINISAGSTSNNASAFVFSNGNNISFGLNGSTITASAAQSVQTQSNVQGISAGTQVARTGDIVFANSNGMTFGLSGSSQLTASYSVPSTAGLLSAINLSAGTTSQNLSALTFSNQNGVTFGLAGSVITASIAAVAGAQTGISGIANSETTFSSGTVGFSELGAITIRSTTGNQLQFSVAPQSNQAIGLYASSQTFGQSSSSGFDARSLSFVGSGGISIGLSAGSILISGLTTAAQTNQSVGLYATGNTTQNSSTTLDARSLSFNGLGAATVGFSNGSIQISAPVQTAQTQSNVQGIIVSNTTYRTGDVSFSNANGISFGSSAGQAITASYTVPGATVFSNSNNVTFGLNGSTVTATASFAQSAQTIGLYGSSQTYGQSSSSTVDARSLSIVGSGGVSVGMSAGSLLISGQTTAAQTAQSIGLYASSQTFGQSSSSTIDARSLSVVGSGGVSIGMSAGSLLISGQTTVAQSVQTQSTVAINGSTGAISFANSNGITFGFNASTVTASHNGLTSQTVQTQSNVQGISAGTQVGRTGDIVFSNSNGISFGLSGSNTLTASYTVPGATVFSNSNNVSFGLNGSTVTATATFAQTAQTMGLYGSSQTYGQSSSSTIDARSLSVVGSGGVSVGMSAGSLLISGQTTVAQSAQTQSNVQGIVVSNTTYRTGDVSFSNLNGISFGSNGANVVTASYTVPTQSAQTIGLYASSQTVGQSSSSTVDARSLTIVGMGGVSAGMSAGSLIISGGAAGAGGVAMSAGTQSVSTGTMVFSNSNGVTFGMSGSSQITASHNGLTTQSNQVVSAFAASNTTQSTAGTFNASSMIIAGAGVVSVGVSNGSIVISAPAAAASPVNFSAGTTSGNLGSVVFSNANGVSFGLNGSTVTASAAGGGIGLGNSQTTYTSGNAIMSVVGGAMTIASTTGQSFNFSVPQTSSLVGASGILVSTNGSTISIYQPLVSYFANGLPYLMNSQTQTVQQSTSVMFPMQVREAFSAGYMRMAHTVSLASTSFASTANSAYSYNQQETHNVVLYSLGTGASSMSLRSFSSSSVSFRYSINVSQNTTNNISVTHGLTYPVSNGTSSLSFSYAATNSTMQVSTTHMTALSGMKLWDTQFAASVPTGRLFMAYGQSTTQTTQGTAALSACRILHSQIGMSQPNNTLGFFGSANNASIQFQQGIGSFSVAGGGTSASLNLSQVSSSASHVVPYIQFVNQA